MEESRGKPAFWPLKEPHPPKKRKAERKARKTRKKPFKAASDTCVEQTTATTATPTAPAGRKRAWLTDMADIVTAEEVHGRVGDVGGCTVAPIRGGKDGTRGLSNGDVVEDVVYDLRAVLYHRGTTAFHGHYTATVRDDGGDVEEDGTSPAPASWW